MNEIIKYLQDPAWWFTAVFVAIMASVASGFMKDAIGKHLARISKVYAEYKTRKDKEYMASLSRLTTDHAAYQIHVSYTTFRSICLYFEMMMYAIFGSCYIVLDSIPGSKTRNKYQVAMLCILFGILSFVMTWTLIRDIRLMKAAHCVYSCD